MPEVYARTRDHNPAPNESAARIVAGPEARAAVVATHELEAAWQQWSSQIQEVDERNIALLRVAFAAGWEARSMENS